jgi:hypothetical protein
MAGMPPEVRYARSGDLRIAYQVVGDGPVDVGYTTGASSYLDLIWENPQLKGIPEQRQLFAVA